MLDEQQMLDAIHQSIFLRGFLVPGGMLLGLLFQVRLSLLLPKLKECSILAYLLRRNFYVYSQYLWSYMDFGIVL